MLLRIPLLVGRHRVGRTLAARRSGEFEHACTMFDFEPRHAREVHRMISPIHGAGTHRSTRHSTRNRADAHRRKHSHQHPLEKKLPSPKPWARSTRRPPASTTRGSRGESSLSSEVERERSWIRSHPKSGCTKAMQATGGPAKRGDRLLVCFGCDSTRRPAFGCWNIDRTSLPHSRIVLVPFLSPKGDVSLVLMDPPCSERMSFDPFAHVPATFLGGECCGKA